MDQKKPHNEMHFSTGVKRSTKQNKSGSTGLKKKIIIRQHDFTLIKTETPNSDLF